MEKCIIGPRVRRWLSSTGARVAGVIVVGVALATGITRTSEAGASTSTLVSNAMADSDLQSGWVTGSCQACHRMDEMRSHPVGVMATTSMAAGLPLENGTIGCTTCHLDDPESHLAARLDHKAMLRPELAGGNACATCHGAAVGDRVSMHALAVGKAHLKPESGTTLGGRDAQSQACIACHDGLVSSEANYGLPNAMDMGLGAHPVGMAYPVSGQVARETGATMRVVPAAMLDRRVQLNGGQVTCTTCHSPYSSERKLLVMSNVGSQLCLSCHDQR